MPECAPAVFSATQRLISQIFCSTQALTVLDSAGRQSLPQEGRYAPTAVYCLALAAGPASVPDPPRETVFSKRCGGVGEGALTLCGRVPAGLPIFTCQGNPSLAL